MTCEACRHFPAPTARFDEVAFSMEQHATLFRCKACGILYELSEDKKTPQLTWEEAKRRYRDLEILIEP